MGRIRTEVEQVLLVDHELPWLAPYLDDGRLDLDRVRPVTDALRQDLADHPEARARFGALMWRWFERAAADSPAQLNKTFTQVRNHVHYVVTKVLAGGRADTGAPTTAAGHAFPTGHWSRPVINVTVPIQTLMGLSDEPGRMGETTLPASLVRLVASEPGSTWHRLLTDPARHGVELSTSTYRADRPDLAGGRRHPADVLRADVHPQRHHLRPRPPSPVAAGSDVIRQTSGPLAVGTTAPSMWRARP